MTRFPALALAIAAMIAPAAARAQTTEPAHLSYTQPLMPTATQAVQERLHQMGAFSGQDDGVWGSDSQAALSQFQQSHGLQATGQMNQATAMVLGLNPADLLGLSGSSAPAAPTPAAPAQTTLAQPGPSEPAQPPPPTQSQPMPPAVGTVLSMAAVRNLQTRLRALGYYNGATDGAWGPASQSAITRFQQASGLPASGRINPQTVTAMGLNPNDLTAPAP